MKLQYVTCSDPRENLATDAVLQLAQSAPIVEIAIQAHPSRMSFGMPRNNWFGKLLTESLYMNPFPNLAVHVNMEWCNDLCQGKIAPEIQNWLSLYHTNGTPVIRRWQINIHGSKTETFNADAIAKLLNNFHDNEFIFQYGNTEYDKIQKLNATGARFSVLYDMSCGTGELAKSWNSPLFANHPQGYAGGLSPENINENLGKIAQVAGNRTDIWIDAEGKLKTPVTKKFDINRAKQYINTALQWNQRQK